jgi:hypothetical protein
MYKGKRVVSITAFSQDVRRERDLDKNSDPVRGYCSKKKVRERFTRWVAVMRMKQRLSVVLKVFSIIRASTLFFVALLLLFAGRTTLGLGRRQASCE